MLIIMLCMLCVAHAENSIESDFKIAWDDVTMATELNGDVKIDRAKGEWMLHFDSSYGPYQLAGYYTDILDNDLFCALTWRLIIASTMN